MLGVGQITIYGLCSLLATVILILLIKRPAELIGLVDRPGGRKDHEDAVPLCGGPAMMVAFCSLVLAFGLAPSTDYYCLIVGVLLLAIVGGWDDLWGLSVHLRFFVQASVVLFCMGLWGNTDLVTVGDLLGLGDVHLGNFAIPVTLFCVVGVINAFNLSDGIDGLAGGLAVIALGSFALAALAAGEVRITAVAVVLIGVSLGFLLFNLRTFWRAKASVFMGDSGSLFLGFALCWFAIKLSQGDGRAISPVTAGWILGLPIMDTVNVMLRRMLRGEGPFTAGRDHLHHALLQGGLSPRQTVGVLLTVGVAMNIIGLTSYWYGIPDDVMFFTFVGLSAVTLFVLHFFWRLPELALTPDLEAAATLEAYEEIPDLDTSVLAPPPPIPPGSDLQVSGSVNASSAVEEPELERLQQRSNSIRKNH